jgi:hypothetical protein
MVPSERRVLELALIGLKAERMRIDDELAHIRRRLGHRDLPNEQAKRISPNRGRPMSAHQKKAISRAMKARWAAKKKHDR